MQKLNEHFIVGRVKRRVLRTPAIEGWLCDEQSKKQPEPATLPLKKIGADAFALAIPGEHDLAKLGAEASAAATSSEDAEILIGWPENIVIVRHHGTVVYAEGDVVHFGRLALDADHSIDRTGYEYLTDAGIEVRVELTLIAGAEESRELLDPGQQTTLGPYTIEHEHSFDPIDRPSGARHHGYRFVVRRRADSAPTPVVSDIPHPLDVRDADAVVSLARNTGLLDDDEALLLETEIFTRLVDRYEGPRSSLEQTVRETGPHPPTLARLGDTLVVMSAYIGRGTHGEPRYGRATVALDPTGGITIERSDLGKLPGRLRKSH